MSETYTAQQAANLLGIHRKSLYAYVSRGLIKAYDTPGRSKLYDADDIKRLQQAKQGKNQPHKVAKQALSWHGYPVLHTEVSRIDSQQLYYRTHAIDELTSRLDTSFERVTALLWHPHNPDYCVQFQGEKLENLHTLKDALPKDLPPLKRAQIYWSLAEHEDMLAYNLDPEHVAHTGEFIIHLGLSAVEHSLSPDEFQTPASAITHHNMSSASSRLARSLSMESHSHLLDLAMILCAEHELNASTFAARVAASTRASPYSVCLAGLSTVLGQHHAGTTLRIGVWLDELLRARSIKQGIAQRMRRGESWPGLGHKLYSQGDPRAKILWEAIQKGLPNDLWEPYKNILQEIEKIKELGKPSIDLMLVIMIRALDGCDEDALTIFALSRCVGWIAHAMEQYNEPGIIRPRAAFKHG